MKPKTNKQVIRQYKKELSPSFLFKPNLKRSFFEKLEPSFEELEEEHGTLTLQLLHEAVGTPDEVIRSFYDFANSKESKKLSIKYAVAQLMCCVCVGVALWATAVAIDVARTADETYYSTITVSVIDTTNITTEEGIAEEEKPEIETKNQQTGPLPILCMNRNY